MTGVLLLLAQGHESCLGCWWAGAKETIDHAPKRDDLWDLTREAHCFVHDPLLVKERKESKGQTSLVVPDLRLRHHNRLAPPEELHGDWSDKVVFAVCSPCNVFVALLLAPETNGGEDHALRGSTSLCVGPRVCKLTGREPAVWDRHPKGRVSCVGHKEALLQQHQHSLQRV